MRGHARTLTTLSALLLSAATAGAQDDAEIANADRIAELERKVNVLSDELERTRSELAVPTETPLEGSFGFGPGASKVYDITRGLSIGGYGEGHYTNFVADSDGNKNRADMLRAVLYFGYKFTDSIVFNSEIEFEHATTGSTESSSGGSASVEFATLDFLLHESANIRTGLMLIPMGFVNEIHEPPFFFGVNRPDIERQIIPSTWRENGVGLFGSFLDDTIEYKAYVVNGLNAKGFRTGGLRSGRQKGNRALAEHLAFVTRVDWTPLAGLQLGGSVYVGKSGQNQKIDGTKIPDSMTTIWELHSEYKAYGMSLRGLFTMATVSDNGQLSDALIDLGEIDPDEGIGGEMLGGYVEAGYDVMPLFDSETTMALEPFFRYERYDTQRGMASGFSSQDSKDIWNYTTGFSFLPIPNVVIKADYRRRNAQSGNKPDEVNLGIGYVF
jgi:opacity protein-like surface antigen